MKLKKTGVIPASYCDADVKLSAVGAFQMVEDLVTEMMGELGIDGLVCIQKYGAMWIFVRNRIELLRDLNWKDTYAAECFISQIGKGKLFVDTVLKRPDSSAALVSRLEMCAVDLETGKLRKMDTVGLDGGIAPEEAEFDMKYERGKFEPERLSDTVIVRTSDIDYLHHTNNISYIRYLIDQWSVAELSQMPIRAIEVQYAGQTYEGDELQIWSCAGSSKGAESFVILHDEKAVLHCRVERMTTCGKEYF